MWYIILGILSLIVIYKFKTELSLAAAYLRIKYFGVLPPESELINGTVMKIYYSYKSKIYVVYLPISKIPYKNLNIKYYLVDSTKLTDITQQSGISYQVNARMLGGDTIICKKFDEVIGTYEHGQYPELYLG